MNERYKAKSLYTNYYLKAFLMGLSLSFLIFIPFIFEYGGIFISFGEFNSQQLPFYRLAHEAVRNGFINWSHTTDLGSNFISSYSYYLLGSPFFWVTLLFPVSALKYLMGPLLVLKFAFATLTSFIFLQRYVKNKENAILAALLYAFSGFSIYNMFFNNFHEAIVFFPLILASIDSFMLEKKKGFITLSIFICCLSNYYLFFGQFVFIILFVTIKTIYKVYKLSLSKIFFLILEIAMGIGLACVLLVPSLLAVFKTYSITAPIYGIDAVIYPNTIDYVKIIISMFFPSDLPNMERTGFVQNTNSLGAWLPVFGVTGTIAWLGIKRKNWLKTVIWTLLVCVFVPGLNALFHGLGFLENTSWFYMLTLMFALATVMSIENKRTNWKKAIKTSFIISVIVIISGGLIPDVSEKGRLHLGISQMPVRFFIYSAIVILGFALMIYLFRYVKKEKVSHKAVFCVTLVIAFYGMFFIGTGKNLSESANKQLINYSLNEGHDLPITILDGERSDFYQSIENNSMFWDVGSLQSFKSTVSNSILQFYDYIGIKRSEITSNMSYALRAITSVRWMFDDENDEQYFAGEDFEDPLITGWMYYGNGNGYDIWENEYYIPMGFCYDSYITKSEVEHLSSEKKLLLMVKTAIIPDEDEPKWARVLNKFDLEKVDYSVNQYFEDCTQRANSSASSYEYTKKGFEAIVTSYNESVIFFSVPYDEGWSATVNGKDVDILPTNEGFMSVAIPAAKDIEVVFEYKTPGLFIGIITSLVSILVFVLYFVLCKFKVKKETNGRLQFAMLRKVSSFKSYCKDKNISFSKRSDNGFLRRKERDYE